MQLKTKGTITSLNIKGAEVKLTIDVGKEDVAVDDLKRMIDVVVYIAIDDNQTRLETGER